MRNKYLVCLSPFSITKKSKLSVKLVTNRTDSELWKLEMRNRGWSYVAIPIVKLNLNRLLEICLADKTCGQDFFLKHIDPVLK